jgi:NOL1/NOP2/fmu family ribosome biogenesis protein
MFINKKPFPDTMAIHFLNAKEKKKILELLEVQFGITKFSDFHIIQDIEQLYVFTGEIAGINLENLRLSQIGMCIGKITKENRIIFTIQGAQFFGPHANKNIIELSKEDARNYLKGEDIKKDLQDKIYLIKFDREYIGCSKVRNGIIRNNVEQARQINCRD